MQRTTLSRDESKRANRTSRYQSSTYNDGRPYQIAKGHAATALPVVDRYATVHPIVSGFPTPTEFQKAFVRELRIRCYQPATIKSYRNVLRKFLLWYGNMPHKVTPVSKLV